MFKITEGAAVRAGVAAAAVANVSSAAAAAVPEARSSSDSSYRDFSLSRLLKPSSSYFDEEDYALLREGLHRSMDGGVASLADAQEALLGAVPSLEESETTTRDLQATFVQNRVCTGAKFTGINVNARELDSISIGQRVLTARDNQYDHPLPNSSLNLAIRGDNRVAQCVDLLQGDPRLQAAVVSLARDPAIWDAFIKNKKVQELICNRNSSFSQFEVHHRTGNGMLQGRANPFVVAFRCVRNLVWDAVDSLVDMVNKSFGFIDRSIFGGPDSDPLDKPFKACIVLTMLVLALVVLKRNPSSHA